MVGTAVRAEHDVHDRGDVRVVAGIALSGWDRLGWEGGIAERWMRINDRRAVFAALVLLAAYVALLLDAVTIALDWLFGMTSTMPISPMFASLLLVCGGLLAWRLAIRAALVTRLYGWREGVRSIPRAFVANVIDMIAARRAVALYRRARRDGVVRWDKTRHEFPADPATAR